MLMSIKHTYTHSAIIEMTTPNKWIGKKIQIQSIIFYNNNYYYNLILNDSLTKLIEIEKKEVILVEILENEQK